MTAFTETRRRGVKITDIPLGDVSRLFDDASRLLPEIPVTEQALDDAFFWKFYTSYPTKERHFRQLIPFIRPHISKDSKALVMGSGNGRSMMYLAHLGVSIVRGIEAKPSYVKASNDVFRLFEQEELIDSDNCKAFGGNFFPRDYSVPYYAKWGELEEVPQEVDKLNPYAAMGMSLSDFNIIYYYPHNPYDTQLLHLLGSRCRPGTIIVNAADWSSVEPPENVEIVQKVTSGETGIEYGKIYRVRESIESNDVDLTK